MRPATDIPANMPPVSRINYPLRQVVPHEHLYVVCFSGTPPTAEALRDFILFIERHHPTVGVSLLESRMIAQIACNDSDRRILYWLQLNLRPGTPYTGMVCKNAQNPKWIDIKVLGDTSPTAMLDVQQTVHELPGFAYHHTTGDTVTFRLTPVRVSRLDDAIGALLNQQRVIALTPPPHYPR